VEDAERHRRAHAQAPARLGLELRHRRLGFVDALQRPAARLEERGPGLGEGEPPRGPVQQARAEAILEARDVLAHDRARELQLVGREREAAALHHAHEHRDVGQVVHSISSFP
jgi:hypothetical protein